VSSSASPPLLLAVRLLGVYFGTVVCRASFLEESTHDALDFIKQLALVSVQYFFVDRLALGHAYDVLFVMRLVQCNQNSGGVVGHAFQKETKGI